MQQVADTKVIFCTALFRLMSWRGGAWLSVCLSHPTATWHCILWTGGWEGYTVSHAHIELGSMNGRGSGLTSMAPPPTLPMWHSVFLCTNHVSHTAACDCIFYRGLSIPQQVGGQLVPIWSATANRNRAESPEHQGSVHRL